jgi:glycosyltransferase involved in cell wall biosynthesis
MSSNPESRTLLDTPAEGLFERSVSLVCWGYNEEANIEAFLRRADDLLRNNVREYEIVIVDDGSTDRTNEIIRSLQGELPHLVLLTNETNRNVAYSARRAFQAASKEFTFWQTVDWSYDITNLRRFLALLESHDVVAGVRRAPSPYRNPVVKVIATLSDLFVKDIDTRSDTRLKAFISLCNYSLIRTLFQFPMSDYQNVDFYPTRLLQSIEIESDSAFSNPELLLKAYWRGAHIKEVPIAFIPRKLGTAKGTRFIPVVKAAMNVFGFWFKWIVLGRRRRVEIGRISRLDPSEWS